MAVRLRSSRTGRALFLKNTFSSVSGTDFCWRLSKPQDLVQPEVLGKLIELNYLVGSRNCDLPACSIVFVPLGYHVPHPTILLFSRALCWSLTKCTVPLSLKKSLDGGSASHKASTCTQGNTNRINAHRYPRFQPDSNPVLERAKTVHASDGAADVIGLNVAFFPIRY
jgi:hypothetical protein